MTNQPCKHETLLKRIKLPQNQYVCRPKEGGCGEKLILVFPPQFALMTPEQFERHQTQDETHQQAQQQKEQKR